MIWHAKEGAGFAHLFQNNETGARSVCGKATIDNPKTWTGVKPGVSKPCFSCAIHLHKQKVSQ